MTDSSLANALIQVMHDYETKWEKQLQERDEQIDLLEQEILELKNSFAEPTTYGDLFDERLRDRLSKMPNAPSDTIVRESGVVLEHRLREVIDSRRKSLFGVRLVNALFDPEEGGLVFSDHSGEQGGVLDLYKGAMKFIRNPVMHKIIEFQEETAQILVRMIDSLLILLEEGQPRHGDTINLEVTLKSVRLMLSRRPVSKGQRNLYHALIEGEKSNYELAEILGIERSSLAGILGALGMRINKTKGLEGKGGIGCIFAIHNKADGKWYYKLKPILIEALKLEGIIS